MKVELVSITQPLVKKDGIALTPEEFIVYCARVSNPENQLNLDTAPKLIKYCIDNKHWSIFEQVSMSFEIKTSRAIASQLLRHRANFQQTSQRYSSGCDFEPIEFRLQGKTNRQVGDEVINLPEHLRFKYERHMHRTEDLYNDLINYGIASECARFVLPLCTSTTMYMENNVRGWIHYLEVRDSGHAQKEHRLIAQEIKKEFVNNFPNISEALCWKEKSVKAQK